MQTNWYSNIKNPGAAYTYYGTAHVQVNKKHMYVTLHVLKNLEYT